MASDPQDEIDPRNNPESRATERRGQRQVSRGGAGSVAPAEHAPDFDAPVGADSTGTAEGNPLGGVTTDDAEKTGADEETGAAEKTGADNTIGDAGQH